jgi:hypothetical protein
MKLYPIEPVILNLMVVQCLVPKTIWSRTNPADENNLIDIAAVLADRRRQSIDFDRYRNG